MRIRDVRDVWDVRNVPDVPDIPGDQEDRDVWGVSDISEIANAPVTWCTVFQGNLQGLFNNNRKLSELMKSKGKFPDHTHADLGPPDYLFKTFKKNFWAGGHVFDTATLLPWACG